MGTVSLGRFDLISPIAAGGMGVVWRAVHRPDGTEVAVKVLTPNAADREDFILAIKEEIRAVAGLNHPHVIWIHDHGEVDAAAAEASGGALVEGGPWLALEFCEGKTLRELAPKLDWEGIRQVLVELLDALAHAHAQGVIHRDIKLANVLVGGARPGIKLTDFGIMYAVERRDGKGDAAAPVNAGTPAYMAPEQLLGWEDAQGPWTDLYQFGVMAWKLITWGCPAEGDVRELMLAKNAEDWVPFKPVVPVPKGVEAWLMRLMKRWPEERFRCAADAAYALKQLGRAPSSERRVPERLWNADSTTILGTEEMLEELLESVAPAKKAVPVVCNPLPRDWREVETNATLPASLIGAGLGLFGLRMVPVIGREAERDALWTGLASVHRSRTPRVVVLRGPVGSGKTHLADWMCRKADEVGGGISLRGAYAPDGGALQGVEQAIARYLRCIGATREEVERRVDAAFDRFGAGDADEAAHLVALIHPEGEDDSDAPRVQFRNRAERHELLARFLERLARERPVVLMLDDVHYGRDGVRFARHVLRRGPSAVLVLLTVRDDVLARSRSDADRLRRVEARSACASIYVGAISKEHRNEFVQRLLGLEPSLARQIADKTAGNPMFAAQLLADWVDRGLLEPSPTGFRLKEEGVELPMPDDLHDPWRVRINRLVRGHDDWVVPLELAAVLGVQVHTREWSQMCRLAGLTVPRRLLTAMLQNRYVLMNEASRGRSWQFAHSMFREAVLKGAETAGRLDRHHAIAVRLLSDATGGRRKARLAWHMLGAGLTLDAIDPLLAGAEACMVDGDHDEATRLVEAREQTMVVEGVRPSDTRWGRGWLLRARLHSREGEWKDAVEWARKTVDTARDWGWRDLEIEGLALLAGNLRDSDAATARRVLARAKTLAGEGVSGRSKATIGILATELARQTGHLEEAGKWGRRAVGLARQAGQDLVPQALRSVIRVEIDRGHPARALRLVTEAERLARAAGSRYDLAQASFLRGHCSRVAGDLVAAEEALEEAWQLSQTIADPNRMVVKASQGLLRVERERFAAARADFRACLRSHVQQAHLWAHLGMLVTAADDPDDTVWAAHVEPIVRYLEGGWSDPTILRYAQLAADRATRAGFDDRATDAAHLVRAQQGAMA
jgi:serine/threonine protein kinase